MSFTINYITYSNVGDCLNKNLNFLQYAIKEDIERNQSGTTDLGKFVTLKIWFQNFGLITFSFFIGLGFLVYLLMRKRSRKR